MNVHHRVAFEWMEPLGGSGSYGSPEGTNLIRVLVGLGLFLQTDVQGGCSSWKMGGFSLIQVDLEPVSEIQPGRPAGILVPAGPSCLAGQKIRVAPKPSEGFNPRDEEDGLFLVEDQEVWKRSKLHRGRGSGLRWPL